MRVHIELYTWTEDVEEVTESEFAGDLYISSQLLPNLSRGDSLILDESISCEVIDVNRLFYSPAFRRSNSEDTLAENGSMLVVAMLSRVSNPAMVRHFLANADFTGTSQD